MLRTQFEPKTSDEEYLARPDVQEGLIQSLRATIASLEAQINTPETEDFVRGVALESAHQGLRWAEIDATKTPSDWFGLVGFLARRALRAQVDGDMEKALHHTISTAAACAQWHKRIKEASGASAPEAAAGVPLPERHAQVIEAVKGWGLGFCAGSAVDCLVRYAQDPSPGATVDRALAYLRAAEGEPRVVLGSTVGHANEVVIRAHRWKLSSAASAVVMLIVCGAYAEATQTLQQAQQRGHLPTEVKP